MILTAIGIVAGIVCDCARAGKVLAEEFPNESNFFPIDHGSASRHVQEGASIESVGASTLKGKSDDRSWYERQQEEIQENIANNGGVPKW